MQAVKLGKSAARIDTRTLRLASYLPTHLPAPPESCDWSKGITRWGMMENDRLGDCTIAAVAHAVQAWTANASAEVTVADKIVEYYYSRWDGYRANDPSTDNGGVELDVLNQWRKEGFAGHELMAFADTDQKNVVHTKQAILLFGGLYVGLQLPVSAQDQTVWDVAKKDGGVWGGHAVYIVGYDAKGLTCITWGAPKRMTWAFWLKYCDEAHALLGKDWLGTIYLDNKGFNLAALQNDLKAVTH